MPDTTYTIKVEINGLNGNSSDGNASLPTTPKGSISEFSTKSYAGLQVAQYATKRLLSYATSSIEMYTGNSVLQEQVNSGLRLVGYAAAIAVNPVLGLAAMAIDIGTTAATRSWEMKWENREAEQMARRSGNYLSNGGR